MPETFMHELNEGHGATVDTRLVPLIKFLNRLMVTTTGSSITGNFATITFTGDYKFMSELLFNHLRSMTYDVPDAQLDMILTRGSLIGAVRIPPSALDKVSSRVGGWLEMLHK
jgi:hypothetical protein